jgi:acetyl/propionyl-CoA carboxylase alpha subunit
MLKSLLSHAWNRLDTIDNITDIKDSTSVLTARTNDINLIVHQDSNNIKNDMTMNSIDDNKSINTVSTVHTNKSIIQNPSIEINNKNKKITKSNKHSSTNDSTSVKSDHTEESMSLPDNSILNDLKTKNAQNSPSLCHIMSSHNSYEKNDIFTCKPWSDIIPRLEIFHRGALPEDLSCPTGTFIYVCIYV